MIAIFFQLKKNIPALGKNIFSIMVSVPIIAMLAYLGMALNVNEYFFETAGIQSLRYADWLLTTPLLLYILSKIALNPNKNNTSLVRKLIFLDIIMIVTGGIAGYSETAVQTFLFGLSSLAFIGILIIIQSSFKKHVKEKSIQVQKYYTRLSILLLVTWTIYPFIWLISSHGLLPSIDLETEVLLYTVVDVFSKGLFGYYLLGDGQSLAAAVNTADTYHITKLT